MRSLLTAIVFMCSFALSSAQQQHSFALGGKEFLLDGKPFQIISGEMHPARIPREYWRHRIQMAKAMGCNTIAVYVFWNYQESSPGVFDFSTGNKDIAAFIKLCQAEGMWVLLRPGPYVCAEWDWGGLPPYLLKIPDIKVRCMDKRYMAAVESYVRRLSKEVAPLQCNRGGPILMVQIENEYGSYGNDKGYLEALRNFWIREGIKVPFYTADGATDYMLEAGNLDGCAIGLDSGTGDGDFAAAARRNPDVPSFSSETYPGWLTHWKEAWQKPDTADLIKDVTWLLQHKKSFNLYVVHGGTNFGFTAGANAFSPLQFQPDVTSYDYDAPINEQGQPTAKYYALRRVISQYVSYAVPEPPPPVPTIAIPSFTLQPFTSLWNSLPDPVQSPQPLTMESLDQKSGLILYRTKLIGHKSGNLTITEPHDYALVFLNGNLVDTVFREGGKWTVKLPKSDVKDPVLEILVEAMGHINFAQYLIDRKGITDRVTLNGMTLMNWDIFQIPLDEKYMQRIQGVHDLGAAGGAVGNVASGGSVGGTRGPCGKQGVFFKGSFGLTTVADTYLDMSNFKKGVVWVNGHNLGRYWYVGPQQRLYCPAGWLKKGNNEVIVFDLHQLNAAAVSGLTGLY